MDDWIARVLHISAEGAHFEEALTHPSFRNERPGVRDNQRLEFLGDAVLGFCTSELLWDRFPDADEGTLTRMRARLVNAQTLAEWARENDLADALRLGRGAQAGKLGASTNVLADAVEALIAATFLDSGLDAARRVCEVVVGPTLAELDSDVLRDPKSELQERVQAQGLRAPSYQVVDSGGPAHEPWFVVAVSVEEQTVAEGRGGSKRQAERAAAAAALESRIWERATEDAGDAEEEDGEATCDISARS